MPKEHIRKKPACMEYCYIDPAFCPLTHYKKSDSSEEEKLKMTVKRWDGKDGITIMKEGGTGVEDYEVDFARKKTPGDLVGGNQWKNGTGTDFYGEQIELEHEWFSPFSCWGDGSGFEYDIMPQNVTGPSSSMESLYDISYFPINHTPLKLSDWNAWIDKFQVDYRWGQVSDQNAETRLFPNVDDPWMFTEYVFKGAQSGDAIVEPPLYSETTLLITNFDKTIDEAGEDAEMLEKYSEYNSQTGDGGRKLRQVKSCRIVKNWADGYPVQDAGGKLYKVSIPVESVKWGEHGNIPPGTINMGAPKAWMDPGQNNAKIIARYVAHLGSPFFACSYGVVYWHNKEAYIDPIEYGNPQTDGDGRPYIAYEVKETGPHGVKQNTPKDIISQWSSSSNNVKRVNIHLDTGEISHGGCGLCKGSGGKIQCDILKNADTSSPDFSSVKTHFGSACLSYSSKNTDCPKFTASRQYPILADYEATANNMAEWAEKTQQMNTAGTEAEAAAMLGGTAAAGVTNGWFTNRNRNRPDIYNDNLQVNVWYEAQFEMVYENDNAVKVKKGSSANAFGKGTEVIRGSGIMALDTKEYADGFRGDTPFFGDMDQVSFSRWFDSPMFCANPSYCNETCGGFMKDGFDPGERAGSSDGKCRYFRSGLCPTNGVNKRAFEFQQTMVRVTSSFLPLGSKWASMNQQEQTDFNLLSTTFFLESDESHNYSSDTDGTTVWNIYFFYMGNKASGQEQTDYSSNVSATNGGLKVKSSKTITRNNVSQKAYLIGKLRIKPVYEEDSESGSTVFSHNEIDAYYWYDAMDNSGSVVATWFCRCDPKFSSFQKNTIIITNDSKFIGGYHPQYKDYSKRGEEFLMDVESDAYRDAMGDIIGDVDNDGQPQPVNKQGYWTDESGDYIVDEMSTGVDQEIADDQSRESTSGTPVSISFKKSNTFIDGATGESESPKTVNCAVNSNDPYNLLEFYKTNGSRTPYGSSGRPMYEDSKGEKYWAPPQVYLMCIPTMRLAAHCPSCGYYLSWRYHDLKCPWCGSNLTRITGDKGSWSGDGAVGQTWPSGASVLKKFFKLNAIGSVQVWAPPGTCIPKDGYFWKNPTVVTNTIIRQLKYRLGDLKEGSGWSPISTMSKEKDFSLGYPEQMGYFKPSEVYVSEDEEKEIYKKIKWEGVTKEQRDIYSSVNEVIPPNPIPGFVTDDSIEQFILPYTATADDGLKMILADELISLRNRIEPVMAYCSDVPSQSDYPAYRASYEKRTSPDIVRYSLHTNCRVPSVILAANESGNDAYVQFWSGDPDWGSVREYYPPGLSWWWLNQVMGCRWSSLGGGYYHMDSPDFGPGGGRETVSKCAIFIHGVLPLDKEILKAYLIISPAGEPSKDPIGRGWNGKIHWEHYHANNTDYVWDDINKQWVCPHKEDGRIQHLHGQAGYKGIWDDNGDYHDDPNWQPTGVVPMAEGGYFGWGSSSSEVNDHVSIYNDHFMENWVDLCGVQDDGQWKFCGADKKNLGDGSDPVYVYNTEKEQHQDGELPRYNRLDSSDLKYNLRHSSGTREREKFQYIGLDKDRQIRLNYTKDEIWQDKTQKEFLDDAEQAKSKITWTVSNGDKEQDLSRTFEQYTQQFVDSVYPSQMQGIAGYFNFENINSLSRMPSSIAIEGRESEQVPDHPIIVQADGEPSGGGNDNYSGSLTYSEAGILSRVMDVTPQVKSLYNKRISRRFFCQAGKTLEEVSKRDFTKDSNGGSIPRWEGTAGKSIEEKTWNKQTKWSGDGYLLTDSFTYPKVDASGNLPQVPDEGDQYPLAEKGIDVLCQFTIPMVIPYNCRRYWISHDGASTEPSSLPIEEDDAMRLSTSEEVRDILLTIFGDQYEAEIISSSSIMLRRKNCSSSDSLEIKEVSDNCYAFFGLSPRSLVGIQDRCTLFTSCVSGYSPAVLISGSGSWVTNTFDYKIQKAVFDLARAPIEVSERDYRYSAPSVNISNCKCDKSGCAVHLSGLTVGVWGERHNITISDGQTNCPKCGTDLSNADGAVVNPGDGLHSYEYEEEFNPDPFITGIEVKLGYDSSFSISAKTSSGNFWKTILSATWNPSDRKYSYVFMGRTYTNISSIPQQFKLERKNWFKSRYVQLEIDPLQSSDIMTFSSSEIAAVGDYYISVRGQFNWMGNFNFSDVNCKLDFPQSEDPQFQINTLSYAAKSEDGATLTFYFKKLISSSHVTKITLKPKRFYSSVSTFKVYGFHYQNSSLTMTGPSADTSFLFDKRKFYYKLPDYPTQLQEVSVGRTGSGGITLSRTDSKSSLSYTLTAHQVPVKIVEQEESLDPQYEMKTIYSISSGNYYFDHIRNRIFLPSYGTYGGNKINVIDFEKEGSDNKYKISFFPSSVNVKYWTGSGESVTLEAQAEGQGPSYQLEKNTIIKIESLNGFESNGQSELMPDMSGNTSKRDIPWVCYNHIPATLAYSTQMITGGTFKVPQIPSTYLGKTIENDKFFVDRFGENNSAIVGRCVTEVTFYGAPDKVISGRIPVSAPAYTEYEIDAGDSKIHVKERTGGIENGCLIVKLRLEQKEGRQTFAFSKPTLLIYARERSPEDPF